MEKRRKGRVIYHVDMNSFYASVEVVHNPSLKGKPLAIAGNPKERRGIVVTASYEARAFGVKTTMPVWEAKRKCPSLIVRPPNFDRYRAASKEMFRLLREYSELVEPVSIDEGYMDVTINANGERGPDVAKEIQDRLLRELGLPCSIGIAPNKFLAKMASDMKKPLGITVLRKREIKQKLWPLPIGEMHGIGKKTEEKLHKINLYTIKDLANYDKHKLTQALGINGKKLHERANGHDERPVDPEAAEEFKSIGKSTTLPADTRNEDKIKTVLRNLSEKVAERMKQKQVCTDHIQMTIRYNNRKNVTRSRKLDNPLTEAREIEKEALFLFQKYWNETPVRLLGVTALQVIPRQEAYKQLDLFHYKEDIKQMKIDETVQRIQSRFGKGAVRQGDTENEKE